MSASVAVRNIIALRSMPLFSARSLEYGQLDHPDHRYLSQEGNPFPCPGNGVVKAFADIDFRSTNHDDIPEGMTLRKTGKGSGRTGTLGKSKWDFAYMESGNSIAHPILMPRHDQERFMKEVRRIKNLGFTMCSYQKRRGYIDPDFLVQASVEEIIVGSLSNGDPIVAPHVVFWRVDGTQVGREST